MATAPIGTLDPDPTALGAALGRDEARALAELLQALGDPTRLQILSVLGTACVPVGTIVAATGLRQPSVSHHLRVLRDRGIVRAERRGAHVYYCATSEALGSAVAAARALLEDQRPAVTTARPSGHPGGDDVAVLARQLAVGEQRRDDREPAEEVS